MTLAILSETRRKSRKYSQRIQKSSRKMELVQSLISRKPVKTLNLEISQWNRNQRYFFIISSRCFNETIEQINETFIFSNFWKLTITCKVTNILFNYWFEPCGEKTNKFSILISWKLTERSESLQQNISNFYFWREALLRAFSFAQPKLNFQLIGHFPPRVKMTISSVQNKHV